MKFSHYVCDVQGGPGWVISGENLLPKIVDLELFEQSISADPLAEPLRLLWNSQPVEALNLLEVMASSPRQQALKADCLRDMGQFVEAEKIYRKLISEVRTSPTRATYHQHLGKVLLYAHQYVRAQEEFETALTLRKSIGASADLLASSQQACDFMQALKSSD